MKWASPLLEGGGTKDEASAVDAGDDPGTRREIALFGAGDPERAAVLHDGGAARAHGFDSDALALVKIHETIGLRILPAAQEMRKRATDDGHEGADRELPARREAKPARGARGRARQRDGQKIDRARHHLDGGDDQRQYEPENRT